MDDRSKASDGSRGRLRAHFAAQEEWRAVAGYEGRYEVSSLGRVRSLPRVELTARGHRRPVKGGILKPMPNSDGYWQVSLRRNGKMRMMKVARLVAVAFLGDAAPDMQVGHLDGTRTNDAVINLKWVDALENASHKRQHGTILSGEAIATAKLTENQVREIKRRAADGERPASIYLDYPVCRDAIHMILRGATWHHVQI